MSTEEKAHGGRFQAQGDDIKPRIYGGVSTPWDQDEPATKAEGDQLLDELLSLCEPREAHPRRIPFQKARRKVASLDYNVEQAGIPYIRSFYCTGAKFKNMRVDVEIKRGRAWKADDAD